MVVDVQVQGLHQAAFQVFSAAHAPDYSATATISRSVHHLVELVRLGQLKVKYIKVACHLFKLAQLDQSRSEQLTGLAGSLL